jgi:hypothetical protein
VIRSKRPLVNIGKITRLNPNYLLIAITIGLINAVIIIVLMGDRGFDLFIYVFDPSQWRCTLGPDVELTFF